MWRLKTVYTSNYFKLFRSLSVYSVARSARCLSPKHTSSSLYKPRTFHVFLNSFSTRALISCFSKPVQIFGKVIGYGDEVHAWSQRDPPPAFFQNERRQGRRKVVWRLSGSLLMWAPHSPAPPMKVCSLHTLNFCDRSPSKREPLFINLLLASQR